MQIFRTFFNPKSRYYFILVGLVLALAFWFIESFMDVAVFHEVSFKERLLSPDAHETWKRILVISLLLLFCVHVQRSSNLLRKGSLVLQERDKERASILENNPAAIMLVDAETREVSWLNSKAQKMIGLSKLAIVGRTCHSFLCPGDRGNCPVLDLKEEIDHSERVLLDGNGKSIPILKSVIQVRFNGREHLLESFFDLTDRKKMERDLKLAHAELDRIFQTTSTGMRLIDKNFNVIKVNNTFAMLSGVPEGQALGQKCYQVFFGARCFTRQCPLVLIAHGTESVSCKVDKIRPDGSRISCLLTASPHRDEEGRLVGILESFQDISQLERARDIIESERDKFDRILSNLEEGVAIVNSDYVIEYANSILEHQFGSLVEQPCYKVFHGLDHPCSPCQMELAIRTGRTRHLSYETPEEKYFEKSYTSIVDVDNRKKVVVLLQDNTEKKKTYKAMMHAEKLAALGELAAGVAHEINNPINGIINYGQILANKYRDDSMAHKISGRVVKEGNRIAKIVEGLLSFARQRPEEKTPLSVNVPLFDALALLDSQLYRDGISVQLNMEEQLQIAMGQSNHLQQVFVNLISNARHALNQRYAEKHEDKVLEISAGIVNEKGQNFVRVSFLDHGIGIREELLERIFDPFFSTKADAKRTGLGLSISHGIVEDHQGRLLVDSVAGQFTRVCVYLPVSRETPSQGLQNGNPDFDC